MYSHTCKYLYLCVCISVVIEEMVINSRGSGDTEGGRGDNGRVKII